MGVRRTRKEKEQAKHSFNLSWNPEPQKKPTEATVKGQFNNPPEAKKQGSSKDELANLSDKDENIASAKRDIVRSLIISGAIVGLEIVLYLAWNV
jgi:hypothetical protein